MRYTSKNISGVTLVSLLVGIALGAFLIIMMLQIFAASRANFQLSKNLNELDNTIRYVSIVMNDIINQAGYRTPNPSTGVLPDYSTVFQPFNSALYGPTGSAYSTTNYPNSDDPAGVVLSYFPGENVFVSAVDPNSYDKVWVKFQGDANGRIRDCNDLYGDGAEVIKIRFYSRTASVGNGVTGTAYYCERQNDDVDYTYSDQPTGTTLIPAALFDQAFIRYGEDMTGNGYIDRWALGNEVQDRNRVYALRVAILVHTRDNVRSTAVEQTFNFFDQNITFNDLKIHKLYMFTIMLPYAPNYKLASSVVTP